ncbi:hypothetical protein NDU88_000606 [Pleurodeles waltl]|uniref:Uncharacterized protein n=1 Tax=Pleurodeles waltl TaxID=8319 RepID=A0AAV7V7C7_PLEWA|nr:hypothetical protein NDU88_000606 [Pleurodeles waltl]
MESSVRWIKHEAGSSVRDEIKRETGSSVRDEIKREIEQGGWSSRGPGMEATGRALNAYRVLASVPPDAEPPATGSHRKYSRGQATFCEGAPIPNSSHCGDSLRTPLSPGRLFVGLLLCASDRLSRRQAVCFGLLKINPKLGDLAEKERPIFILF